MATWLQSEFKRNGYDGSIYDPALRTKDGEWDLAPTGKIYGEILPQARNSLASFNAGIQEQKEENAAGMVTSRERARQEANAGTLETFSKKLKDSYGNLPAGVLSMNIGDSSPKGWSVQYSQENPNMVQVSQKEKGKQVDYPLISLKDWIGLQHEAKQFQGGSNPQAGGDTPTADSFFR